MDRKELFDAIRGIKAEGAKTQSGRLSQAEVDRINAILDPVELAEAMVDLPTNPKFPMSIILGAREAMSVDGIPASVSLAQWALESGYGKHMPPNSNNPFGMKARKNETGPVVYVETKEQRRDGSWYTIRAPFRKFASIRDAFLAHNELLATARVYAPARAKLPDPWAFVDVMGPIYATAQTYAETIKSIMRTNNLTAYDVRP